MIGIFYGLLLVPFLGKHILLELSLLNIKLIIN